MLKPLHKRIISARLGIDASMNSTGVAFIFEYSDDSIEKKFFVITPERIAVSSWAQNIEYNRIWNKDNYSIEEMNKILSARKLSACIHKLIIKMQSIYGFESIECRMEGSIVNTGRFNKSASRVNDLTMFNCSIKTMLVLHPLVCSIAIIPPKTLKKLATGKGNAKKELMVSVFFEVHEELIAGRVGKVDDMIDAYWLAYVPYSNEKCFVKSSASFKKSSA